jgi:hypothetical protein
MWRIWARGAVIVGGVGAVGCKPSVEAPASLSEAMRASLVSFDADDATLAPAVRALEEQLYRTVPVRSANTLDRSVEPDALTVDDIAGMSPRPDRDPAAAIKTAVAWSSPHPLAQHARIPLLEDQRPLEPSSPDDYDRTFLAGQDCWADRGCALLQTYQSLTKVYTANIIPPITYTMYKDFRWVDLHADLGGEPRYTWIARSWDDEPASSENGKNTIWASYTLEAWLPQDGAGFVWGDEAKPTEDHGDSVGGGTVRLLVLWTETEFAASDDPDIQVGTIRWGIDQNMKAHDAWLDENP